MKHIQKRKFSIVERIRRVAFVLFLLLFIAFFVGWLPIRPVAVATGSMEPSIHVGDAVVVMPAAQDKLQEGDVIQYKKDGYMVVHRIVEITDIDGQHMFITKGDNNNAPDTDPVAYTAVVGRVVFTIPKLGYVTLWLHGQLS